ncbi:PilZ domain-containing protein [Hydrogenophilus thiooxidans]|uniref:PilZ domain-containing protein n=1 Tax=Hydrogenophilus thiooxidans TaxID=2820326 RepID=UPI001C23BD74|nr:PilZ domain-containing protein [Hydrogenophilus thiooxidans]
MTGAGSYLTTDAAPSERRRHQRIYVALVSPRRFRVDLLGVPGGNDCPVYDLSLGGFSCGRPQEIPTAPFPFVLHNDGDAQPIRGEAEVRAVVSDGRIGCAFVALDPAATERLTRWLIDYILTNARVRIDEEEARAIVEGNSFL